MARSHTVWLPSVSAQPTRPYGLSEYAYRLYELIVGDPLQRRKVPRLHPILCAVAKARCNDMQTRNYFSHVDPDGYGPNYHVRQANYTLPDWYDSSPSGNNIESLALNYITPQLAYDALIASPHHRDHILGLLSFYADQTNLGVATAGDVKGGKAVSPFYWCFLSAHPY